MPLQLLLYSVQQPRSLLLAFALVQRSAGDRQGEVIHKALQCRMQDGQLLFDSVQATWNLLEQSAGELQAQHVASVHLMCEVYWLLAFSLTLCEERQLLFCTIMVQHITMGHCMLTVQYNKNHMAL